MAIILTSRQPAYEQVANELGARLEKFTIYDLSDRSQPPVTAFRQINDSESGAVVAIGLRAAKSSLSMAKVPIVFSQVFNYHDHRLITESSRGVSALPPLDAHLAACVNAITGVKSFYRWKGKIESDSEVQLLIKTQPDRFDEIARWLEEHHPYEVPEIVALPADKVSDAYLQWAITQLE